MLTGLTSIPNNCDHFPTFFHSNVMERFLMGNILRLPGRKAGSADRKGSSLMGNRYPKCLKEISENIFFGN